MLSLGPRANRWPKVQTLTPKPCGERDAAQSKNEASNLYPEEPGEDFQLLQSRSFKTHKHDIASVATEFPGRAPSPKP